jgi:16S rRNA U516 pseudouridylate synthase RsuA-like enzyme
MRAGAVIDGVQYAPANVRVLTSKEKAGAGSKAKEQGEEKKGGEERGSGDKNTKAGAAGAQHSGSESEPGSDTDTSALEDSDKQEREGTRDLSLPAKECWVEITLTEGKVRRGARMSTHVHPHAHHLNASAYHGISVHTFIGCPSPFIPPYACTPQYTDCKSHACCRTVRSVPSLSTLA